MVSKLKQILSLILGWILIFLGITGIIFPILPGWIFVFIGAFLLGWITKKQLNKLKRELTGKEKLDLKFLLKTKHKGTLNKKK